MMRPTAIAKGEYKAAPGPVTSIDLGALFATGGWRWVVSRSCVQVLHLFIMLASQGLPHFDATGSLQFPPCILAAAIALSSNEPTFAAAGSNCAFGRRLVSIRVCAEEPRPDRSGGGQPHPRQARIIVRPHPEMQPGLQSPRACALKASFRLQTAATDALDYGCECTPAQGTMPRRPSAPCGHSPVASTRTHRSNHRCP